MTEIVNYCIILFKSMEWFFWGAVIFYGFHLVFTRVCFDSMVRFINWMFRIHDFDGSITGNSKAFKRYRRDIIVLFVLNVVLIGLIKAI